LARIEYVSLVDPDTFVPQSALGERGLVALAVWVGSTRLIDNRLLVVPAMKTERRSA
jgi:pantothenate synthetase